MIMDNTKLDFFLKVKTNYSEFFSKKKVLTVQNSTSYTNVAGLFDECNYFEITSSNNDEHLRDITQFEGPDNFFDTIIYFSNDDNTYKKNITRICNMLKPGGLFMVLHSSSVLDFESNNNFVSTIKESFDDGYFDEIPGFPNHLFFYSLKHGFRFYSGNINIKYNFQDPSDHIFVIDCWPDNESKESDLINLIKYLREFNIEILLCGHYPIKPQIQKMVDYFLFDRNNPILLPHEFESHDVSSGRWTSTPKYKVENMLNFHHDYAIWLTMKNAFNFCNTLNKKYIHFLEYDNAPDTFQYKQAFLERIYNFDAVIYEYSEGSSVDVNLGSFCATFIFSIKTNIALNLVNQINSRQEYFTNKPQGWQLERVFLDSLRKVTNNFLRSEYVPNKNELNTQAVWNRDGVSRNGARFQPYLAVDKDKNLYIHLISGFHEIPADSDYLIELNYGKIKKFIDLKKDQYHLEPIGPYRKGDRVKLFYQGVEVFDEFLGEEVDTFAHKHRVKFHDDVVNINQLKKSNPTISYNFTDGPFIEIIDSSDTENEFCYNVDFIDLLSDKILYSTQLRSNHWARAAIKYYVDWRIKITGINTSFEGEINFEPKNRRFLISFESSSLGDNLAWIASVEEFRLKNQCHVICSTFFNELFVSQYPYIEFVSPGTTVNGLYGLFRLGLFLNSENKLDMFKHPTNPLKIPLIKVSSDILGLNYMEIKPILPTFTTNKLKRVCIAIHSTSQCKYWNNPDGWQEVVNFLRTSGYEVRLLSREEDGFMGNKNPKGVVQQKASHIKKIAEIIQESELFIGISSGLSWLSWGLGTPTVLISGFTDKYLEPQNGVKRIINESVCHGCWHDHEFDKRDWNWCPKHKGTDRQFECTKEITSQDVIKAIQEYIN